MFKKRVEQTLIDSKRNIIKINDKKIEVDEIEDLLTFLDKEVPDRQLLSEILPYLAQSSNALAFAVITNLMTPGFICTSGKSGYYVSVDSDAAYIKTNYEPKIHKVLLPGNTIETGLTCEIETTVKVNNEQGKFVTYPPTLTCLFKAA